MAYLTMNMRSVVLQMDTSVNVLLPEKRYERQALEPNRKYPVLYLLHGHGDDHSAWIRKSMIEYLTRDLDMVVVMPTVYRSYYTDCKYGLKCLTYVAEELPVKMANFFPISTKREDTFVAGNSMGGYGAFRLALGYPEKYGAAASFSGALTPFGDIDTDQDEAFTLTRSQDYLDNRYRNFGSREEFAASDNNLVRLVRRLNQSGKVKPMLYQCCGTEDFVTYGQNVCFHKFMEQEGQGFGYEYFEGPGNHNWDFWNPQIPVMLKKFGLKKEV